MATIIRKVRNNRAQSIFLTLEGIELPPSVIVDLYDKYTDDKLKQMQGELQGLIDRGSISLIESDNLDELHPIGIDSVATHVVDVDAHHTRYADSEALAASVQSGALSGVQSTKAPTHFDVLNGIAADGNLSPEAQQTILDDHTHSNKALLDTYTQTEVDLADAVTKKHDGAAQDTAIGLKAAKTTAVVASDSDTIAAVDSAVTVVVDASAQTGGYVQADVESIRTLANDLKAKYNAAVTTINELKTDYNAAVTLINELKAKIDTMNT